MLKQPSNNTQEENLMHKFDKVVATVVTSLHAVSAMDMMVRRVCYSMTVMPNTRTPPEHPMP